MFELIQQFSAYAPLIIFVAATLDILFLTGLILYGAAMIGSIGAMYSTGMISVEMIILSSYCGTVFGNCLNYGAGHIFREAPFISNKLNDPKVQKVKSILDKRSLPLFMVISRFIALIRPLYALVLGSLDISFKRFLFFELIIALFWVLFWLFIIVQGTKIFESIFG